jgi:hypothetical protein
MGEREGGESRSIGAFLLGFLLGVLVTLGGSATFFMVTQQRGTMMAREAMMQAEVARAEAEEARMRAEKAQQLEERARKAEQAARKGNEKELKGAAKGADPEPREKEARDGVRTLDTAVKAHKATHGDYPNTLDVLTNVIGNKPAALEKAALTDPWGRAYIYDRAKTNPNTGVPLIYSLGAGPKNEQGHIRNW